MRVLSAAAALTLAVLAGCTGPAESGGGGEGGAASEAAVIRLGTLVPLTGRSSYSGQSMLNAAKLAVSEANAAGGVLGRPVELVAEDDACDPGTAVTAAQSLVDQDIAVSVGGYCSSAVVPTLTIFRAAGVPMIVAQANSTDLLAPKYDSVFMICGTVGAEADFAVAWMRRMGSTRLALVHDGTSFPITLSASSATAARAAGLTVTDELKLSQGAPSYARTADAVLAGKADVVYFTGYYGEANQLIKDLRAAGYAGKVVVGDGATDGPLLADLTAAQSTDVYGTGMIFPQLVPALAGWSARYRAAVGAAPGPSTVEAYDAVKVALDAIKRAGSLDHEAIRKAIAATGTTFASGPVSFNPDGSRTVPTFLALRAEDGDLVLDPTGN